MDFIASVQENKLNWTLGTIAWLASCVLIEKIQLRVFASSQAEEANRVNKLNKHFQISSTSLINTSNLSEDLSTSSIMSSSTPLEKPTTLPEETMTLSENTAIVPGRISTSTERASPKANAPTSTLPSSLTSLPWYAPTIDSMLTTACADLLTHYAHVPPSEHESYIYRARDEAFKTLPLGTLGEFWFLVLGLSQHPSYPLLLLRLQSSPSRTLIDIGTCLGQDLRKLVRDGASPSQVYGIDYLADFGRIGCEFFNDGGEGGMEERFRCVNFLTREEVEGLDKHDIVTSSMFLHAFDIPTQVLAVNHMFAVTRGTGSWLMGLVAGDVQPQDVSITPPLVPEGVVRSRYVHSAESLRALLEEVGRERGVNVKVWTGYQEDPESTYTKALGRSFFATERARLVFYLVEIL